MAEVTWFKVLTDIFADDKIKIIQSMPEGDSLLVLWFKVLSQAGKTNDGGYIYLRKNIPYTPAMLATLFNKPQMIVELALKTFTQFEMIDVDDSGYIFVTNWEKHQSIDALRKIKEQDRIRSANYRERKRLELEGSHVTVTLPSHTNHAIEEDKDLDLENKSTTTAHEEFESLEKTHLSIFGGITIAPMWSSYYEKIRIKGYTDGFINELLLEAAETSNGKVSQRFVDTIFNRWHTEGITSRRQSKESRGSSTVGKTGQAAKRMPPAKPDYSMYANERNYDPL